MHERPTGSVGTGSGGAGPARPEPSAAAVWRVTGDPLVAGAPAGPLRGLRVAVKDLFAVRGQRVGAGNPTWLAGAPVEAGHAPAVAMLLAAGADVAGLAHTDEFAYSLSGTNAHYGTPVNPAAPGRAPGGSTSGPASAVALGQADIGLGTDTAGSIRVPASYCGLFGIRPTHGAVPAEKVLPLAPAFDAVGWLARDAVALARVGDVLLPPTETVFGGGTGSGGRTEREHVAGIGGARGGEAAGRAARLLAVDGLIDLADESVAAALRAALPELGEWASLPVDTRRQLPGVEVDSAFAAFRAVQGHQATAGHGRWVAEHPGALGPGIAARFAAAAEVTDRQADAAWAQVGRTRSALRVALAGGSVLVLPAASTPAPDATLDGPPKDRLRAATLKLTCLASLAALPAVVLPWLRVDGLPVGVMLVGAAGTDRRLLALALALAVAGG